MNRVIRYPASAADLQAIKEIGRLEPRKRRRRARYYAQCQSVLRNEWGVRDSITDELTSSHLSEAQAEEKSREMNTAYWQEIEAEEEETDQ